MTTRKSHMTVIAVLVALLASSEPAGAKAPLKVSATPTRLAAGESLKVKYVVGRRPTKLVIRLDRKRLRTVRVRKARGRVSLTLPRSVAPGTHRLTVCVGKTCRSVRLKVTAAKAPAAPPQSPAPAPAPAPAPQPAPQPAPAPVDFTGAPNPLDVEAHTDASRRGTKTIDVTGGTLET